MGNDNVPEVRFAGFDGDWVEKKFSEIVNRISKQSNCTNLPRVEFEDIISGEGRLNKDVFKKIDTRKGIEFESNFILFGKLRPYLQNWLFTNFKGIALGDFWVFKTEQNCGKFVYYLIQTEDYQTVANISIGTKMPRSDWKTVSNAEFKIPRDLEEQAQIGNFFKQLDDTIVLHQRELDNLKQTKKGFLQKMFPKDGETVPEVRFAGFDGDWVERKLGDIGTTYTGLSGKTKVDFGHGKAKYITYMNVFSNTIANINGIERIEIDCKQNQVQYGDVFFTVSSETPEEVGMSSVWLGNLQNIYLNSFCFGYRPILKINAFYLAYVLRTPVVRKKFIFLAQGISRYNISKNRIMDLFIQFPDFEEQTQIGDFFHKFDNIIALKQSELQNLKQIKKAFLQKMFI